jgi:ribosomal protein L37AE/L43A
MDQDTPEEWRWIPGYKGLYKVSNYGQVLSMPRATTRLRLLKGTQRGLGYRAVSLSRDGYVRTILVHQLVMGAFIGACPEGEEIRHLDGDPSNNALSNLAYGDHAANMQDVIRHGRNARTKKTHCPKGHPYSEENTYWYKGKRHCIICRNAADVRRRVRDRARVTTEAKDCAHCGRPFVKRRALGQGARKYCTPECAKGALYERRRSRKAA